jgi:hypothetical protein
MTWNNTKMDLKKQRGNIWTGLIWFGIDSKGNFLEADNILWFVPHSGVNGFLEKCYANLKNILIT